MRNKRVLVAVILFVVTAIFYFLPVDLPHKICIPLSLMALLTIGIAPWQITLALFFSALGDLSGSFKYGADEKTGFYAFVGQMLFFALAHIFYILYMVGSIIKERKERTPDIKRESASLAFALLVCAGVFAAALIKVVPCVSDPVLRVCVIGYCCIIMVMLFCALRIKDIVIGLGALLFVTSDFILAWNMFVGDVPGQRYLIMVPYYLAQLLIALRAIKRHGA